MVSNKNRKTKYKNLDFPEDVVIEFMSCKPKGKKETNVDTMKKLIKTYKSKCPGQMIRGVVKADSPVN